MRSKANGVSTADYIINLCRNDSATKMVDAKCVGESTNTEDADNDIADAGSGTHREYIPNLADLVFGNMEVTLILPSDMYRKLSEYVVINRTTITNFVRSAISEVSTAVYVVDNFDTSGECCSVKVEIPASECMQVGLFCNKVDVDIDRGVGYLVACKLNTL